MTRRTGVRACGLCPEEAHEQVALAPEPTEAQVRDIALLHKVEHMLEGLGIQVVALHHPH